MHSRTRGRWLSILLLSCGTTVPLEGDLLFSFDAPNSTQLEHLRQAEVVVRNAVLASEVAAFRQQAEAAKLGLLVH